MFISSFWARIPTGMLCLTATLPESYNAFMNLWYNKLQHMYIVHATADYKLFFFFQN